MNDLEQIRDALESAKTFLGQEILWKESNYVRGHGEKKYSELCVALSIIDRMIETPAPTDNPLPTLRRPRDTHSKVVSYFLKELSSDEEQTLYGLHEQYADKSYRFVCEFDYFDIELGKIARDALIADLNPAPTEKVDVESLKLEVEKCFPSMNYTESSLVDVVIDHLANTGRLR